MTTLIFQETWTVLMSRSIQDANLTHGNVGESRTIKEGKSGSQKRILNMISN